METEKLCFKGKPVRPEEQEQAWAIYLAILEALIKLDLEKKNWTLRGTNVLMTKVMQYKRSF